MNINEGRDPGRGKSSSATAVLPFTFLSGEERDSFWLRSAKDRGARASTRWARNHRDRFSDVFDLGARHRFTRRHDVAVDHECIRIILANRKTLQYLTLSRREDSRLSASFHRG